MVLASPDKPVPELHAGEEVADERVEEHVPARRAAAELHEPQEVAGGVREPLEPSSVVGSGGARFVVAVAVADDGGQARLGGVSEPLRERRAPPCRSLLRLVFHDPLLAPVERLVALLRRALQLPAPAQE